MLMAIASFAAADSLPAKPFFSKPILLGAHRGGRALWPENTLEAFRNCSAKWPDAIIESDVHLTVDNAVVLLHDDTVDRTTDGAGPVSVMAFANVRKLDAGFHFTTDDGATYPYRGKGIGIPTLAEALDAAPNSRFLIELKNQTGIAEATIAVLREHKALDRIALASFNPMLIARAHEIEPSIVRCYSMTEGVAMLAQLRTADWNKYQPVAEILAIPESLIDSFQLKQEEFNAMRKKQIAILVETINEPEPMRKLIAEGINCILTDHPNILAEVMARTKG